MSKTMGLEARREFVVVMKTQNQAADWVEQVKILDGVVTATGYDRKYLTRLFNKSTEDISETLEEEQPVPRKYDAREREALLSVWYSANHPE